MRMSPSTTGRSQSSSSRSRKARKRTRRKLLAGPRGRGNRSGAGSTGPRLSSATEKSGKAVKVMYEGRGASNDAFIRNMDLYCAGEVTAPLRVPDDKSKPIVFRADTNNDGKVDAWVFDEDRDGKWDYSLWDTDFDGKPDMKGFHPDGKLEPSRYEKYQPKP